MISRAPDGLAAEAEDAWARPRPARAVMAGRMTWDDALELQHELHAKRIAGAIPDTLVLVEHDSVYTAGRAALASHFLVGPDELESRGHGVRLAHRGGDVTWHGPGQLVCYPIFDLGEDRRDVHLYLRRLEDVLVRVAALHGVHAWRVPGRTGAWCAGGKIAAVGIRVARWVTMHGTAFNVAPDLARFDAIVACGLRDARPTSLLRETGTAPDLAEVAQSHVRAFAEVFRLDWMMHQEPQRHVG